MKIAKYLIVKYLFLGFKILNILFFNHCKKMFLYCEKVVLNSTFEHPCPRVSLRTCHLQNNFNKNIRFKQLNDHFS